MRIRGFLFALVMLCALAVSVVTSSAQGPAVPTAFDGKYVGSATVTGGGTAPYSCYPIKSIEMTIAGGQVIIHEILSNELSLTYRGSVNAAGEVSAFRQALDAATMSGTIHDKIYTGQRVKGHQCYFNVQMVKQ